MKSCLIANCTLGFEQFLDLILHSLLFQCLESKDWLKIVFDSLLVRLQGEDFPLEELTINCYHSNEVTRSSLKPSFHQAASRLIFAIRWC